MVPNPPNRLLKNIMNTAMMIQTMIMAGIAARATFTRIMTRRKKGISISVMTVLFWSSISGVPLPC